MKKAYLGIGHNYNNSDYFLPDCELDAQRMSDLYQSKGYDAYLFTEMTIQQFKKIIAELIAMQLDEVVIYYSGHGTQLYDSQSTEQDKYEEALCFWNGKSIELLYDQDFADLAASVAPSVTVIMDCCHSGGMSRNVLKPGHRAKSLQYDKTMQVSRVAIPKSQSLPLFVFASQESQLSYSTGDGGAFTKVFLVAIESGMTQAKEITDYAAEMISFQTANYVGDGKKKVISKKGEIEAVAIIEESKINEALLSDGYYDIEGAGRLELHKAWNKVRVRLNPTKEFQKQLEKNWLDKL